MPLIPLIIDCDPGNGIPGANVDDALALALAWSAPNLEVKSVWTVFGNVSALEGNAAARRIAQIMGVRTPIISGCDVPLTGEKQRRIWREKLDRPHNGETRHRPDGRPGDGCLSRTADQHCRHAAL